MGRLLRKIAPYVAAGMALISSVVSGQNVKGRIIEKGTNNYGIKDAVVRTYYDGKTIPATTKTDAEGRFVQTPVGIKPEISTTIVEAAYSAYKELHLKTNITEKTTLTIYSAALGEQVYTQEINTQGIQELHIPLNLSNTVYMYTLKNSSGIKTGKFVYQDGFIDHGKKGIETQTTARAGAMQKNNGMWKPDSMIIEGENIETLILKEFTLQDLETYDIGTKATEGTNIVTGETYDLDTKYADRTGVEGAIAYLQSTPEKKVKTNANGRFEIKTAKTGLDSVIIEDSTFYNWKHPIEIGKNTDVKAFNDTTGIPMIKRYSESGTVPYFDQATQTWKDSTATEDLIEFTQKITRVARAWLEDPIYKNTIPRFKNKNVFVYLNRKNAPNTWYPDSSMSGLKQLENEKLTFTETTDSANAQIHMRYDNVNTGNGDNLQFNYDEQGPYIKNWDINIRGIKDFNEGTQTPLKAEQVPYVLTHEGEHAVFSSGEHSQFPQDIAYAAILGRLGLGFTSFGTVKEIKARKINYFLERNAKILEHYR